MVNLHKVRTKVEDVDSQRQQSDKSVTLSKVQEIKDEPEDSGNDTVKVENGKEKKKGGRKKQAVIEIEKGSTKLLVRCLLTKVHHQSVMTRKMVIRSEGLMLQLKNLLRRKPRRKQKVLILLNLLPLGLR